MTDQTKEPERIYLQADAESPDIDDCTWCRDQINMADIAYVRADLHEALAAKCAELKTTLRDALNEHDHFSAECEEHMDKQNARIRELEDDARKVDADNICTLQGLIERNKELEGQLATANSAMKKANELHFGVRMRRIEELEGQVRELQRFVTDIRDAVLTPLTQENIGRLSFDAEGLGQHTVQLLAAAPAPPAEPQAQKEQPCD